MSKRSLRLIYSPMLTRSLYIHMPWCIKKCPYCDFNSHKSPDFLPEEQYIDALIDDFHDDLKQFPAQRLSSIFIGGGTPSLFEAKHYAKLLDAIAKVISFDEAIEITLEANPGTALKARFNDYRAIGINRLSLGIQSFNPTHLSALGRIHNDQQARDAIDYARCAGFDNINIDIMHGLPNQTVDEGLADLRTAMSYSPEHLSWYQLTIEPNTLFYKHPPTLPNDDCLAQLEELGLTLLKDNNYLRYEISAFSLNNKPSKHNMNYWLFGDYFGIGAGAHGKLSLGDDKAIYRTEKQRQPNVYLDPQKPVMSQVKQLTQTDKLFEFMLNATRLEMPILHSLFSERTGLSFKDLEPGLRLAQSKGLLVMDESSWTITPFGRRYTNDLQALFLGDIH